MNPLHYPDIERCKKFTEIGFPETILAIDQDGTWRVRQFARQLALLPSAMEMLDVMPEIEGFWFEIYRHKNDKGEYCVSYEGFEGEETACLGNKFFTGTLPNALADLIFWLHENNYIKF